MQALQFRSGRSKTVREGPGDISTRVFAVVYVVMIGLGFGVATIAHNKGSGSFSLAAGIYLLGAAVLVVSPRVGLYLMVFFTLFADKASASWYPFTKNLSSSESVLYIHDSLSFNPLETYLILLVAAIAAQVLFGRLQLHRPPLLIPTLTFFIFLGFGFLWGAGRGGDLNVAVWEIRPFVVLVIVYFVGSSLLRTRRDLYIMVWVVIGTLAAECFRILTTSLSVRSPSGSLLDHQGAMHLNLIFVMLMAAILYRGASLPMRYVLPPLAGLVIPVYLISERRSAFVALAFGAIIIFSILRIRHPRRFWAVAPTLLGIGLMYLAVFWNASGPLGFPAQTVRSQLIPNSTTTANASSDLYREFENINLVSTIRKQPLTGVGFGQKYDQPIPLPNITGFFVWWAWVPHNSVLYIWLRTGVFGFIAMFFWLGSFTQTAIRAAIATKNVTDAVVFTTLGAFFPMYLVYSYVDLAWDTQSMMLTAVAMTVIGGLVRLGGRDTLDDGAESADDAESSDDAATTAPAIGTGGALTDERGTLVSAATP